MGMKSVTLSRDGKELTIVMDMEDIPFNTDKSLVYASSHGFQPTTTAMTVKNKAGVEKRYPLKVSVNAIVPDPDYVKPPKALN